jgi:hypothetical protein
VSRMLTTPDHDSSPHYLPRLTEILDRHGVEYLIVGAAAYDLAAIGAWRSLILENTDVPLPHPYDIYGPESQNDRPTSA